MQASPISPRLLAYLKYAASCSLMTLVMGTVGSVSAQTQAPEKVASIQIGVDMKAEEEKPSVVAWNRAPKTHWIWGADSDSRYALRRTFEASSTQGMLRASCDNRMEILLNGQTIARSDAWETGTSVDLAKHLKVGRNELEVRVANEGGISGLVLQAALLNAAADQVESWVVSDASWTAAAIGEAQGAPARIVANLGDGPWGDVLSEALSSSAGDAFVVRPGFEVERLYTVPREEQGSWVAITFDPKGRLIASDQDGKGLYRITPAPLDGSGVTKVEKLDVAMTAAQGLLYAFDSLYVSANGGPGSGLYRLQDTDGDDDFDKVTKLKEFRGGGEHGPHALRLSPDGKRVVVICGNHTLPPESFNSSAIPSNWDEDLLLPRQWDANGHAQGILAPGGWIASTDPEGKDWRMLSVGYRNPYDMDFNADGELFAYDADMEWDFGTPWYRPTRVVHATSGSEFGWRSGTGKWPTWYADSLPQLVDIGPGSPVGVAFGYGTRFPGKYQRALYICDWTFGTMYAIHIEPEGAGYRAIKEEFVSRTPLPLTDVAVGPDGALYFTIGGRGTQSELFRVIYTGGESTAAVDPRDEAGAEMRARRHRLEAWHHADATADLNEIWQALGEEDRTLRYAARVALEFQPVETWLERLSQESDVNRVIEASIAAARQGKSEQADPVQKALARIDLDAISVEQRLAWYRALELVLIRMGLPEEGWRTAWLEKLDGRYPAEDLREDRELVQLLVALGSESVVEKGIAILEGPKRETEQDLSELLARNRGYGGTIAQVLANQPDVEQVHAAFMLRNAKAGWTTPLRIAYFEWFSKARSWSGGASYQGFLNNIDREAYENASDTERLAVEALGARQPVQVPERPQPQGPGQDWTVESVMAEAGQSLRGRNFENGRRAYAAASCVLCHRFAGEGGATGPDLTQAAGRFGIKDLTEALIEPSKVISDQYRAMVLETADGGSVTGRMISENETGYVMLVDPQDSSRIVEVAKEDVVNVQPSPTSLMPADLLDSLNQDEVLDLLAYVLSRGDQNSPAFR